MVSRILLNIRSRLNQLKTAGNSQPARLALFSTSSAIKSQSTRTQQKDIDENYENNEPIKFFGSQASAWKASASRSGGADEALWYQPYVISASLAAFLIYFCILREENDIDMKLGKNLFDHIEGLEEQQLVIVYKYNRENNLDNSQVVQRLKELNIDVNSLDK